MRQTTATRTADRVFWALAWLLLAVVTVFSVGPEATPAREAGLSDKVLHVGGYAATAAAFLFAAVWRPGGGPARPRWGAGRLVAALALYGVALEVAQAFRPDRTAEVADVVASVGGVAVAAAGWWGLGRRTGGRR